MAGSAADSDPDEFGCALAVADDELGEGLGEGCEDFLEGDAVGGGWRGDGLATCGAVGEESDGVVGGCVAVYAYAVEGAVHGVGKEGLECGGWDRGVGGEDAEEGGHVGVDHAGAFGHAS